MYNILMEFEWFILQRHTFLSKRFARNYTVYVQNIPQEYLSNQKLYEFFENASTKGVLLEVNLARKIPTLQKLVQRREAQVVKLEHAINIEEVKGVTPTTRSLLGETRNAIDAYYETLNEMNAEATERIEKIELLQSGKISLFPGDDDNDDDQVHYKADSSRPTGGINTTTTTTTSGAAAKEGVPSSSTTVTNMHNGNGHGSMTNGGGKILDIMSMSNGEDTSLMGSVQPQSGYMTAPSYSNGSAAIPSEIERPHSQQHSQQQQPLKDESEKEGSFSQIGGKLFNSTRALTKNVTSVVAADKLVGAAVGLLAAEEDGAPFTAGFVTFRTLRATQAALQMIQYPEPFAMEVLEAPEPDDIFWNNVGRTHKELQLGKLFSFALTAALCLLWTIPMLAINTMSSIEGLRGSVDFVDDMIIRFPWVEPVLAQLAPLLIIVANVLLKVLLERLSMLEGPVSGVVVEASLFVKLSAFMIIQTFFVSAVSGSIIAKISEIIDDPLSSIDLLANSLPGQSTFYIQILLVDTFLGIALELLRVVPLVIALVRKIFGPTLTEKERTTTWFGLRPLNEPDDFGHAELLSGSVLYFMVFFVYASTAPVTTFFLGFCFMLMGASYRHQMIYIYPTRPDSGGRLWAKFISLVPTMMMIAEVTLLGLLGLKKSIIGTTLMFPLLVVTFLFNMYIRQKHFDMTEHLPSQDAILQDRRNEKNGMSHEFLKGLYVQPELREKEVLPENATIERQMVQGGMKFDTPQNSEAGNDLKEDQSMMIADQDIDLGSYVFPGSISTKQRNGNV